MTAAPTVRRGRPRSETIDAAIMAATIEEIIDRGFLGLSMESIAERAGVAKTTLYRRWPEPAELGIEAMRSFEKAAVDPPQGSVRDQLLWLAERMRRKWNDPTYAAVMRRVAADGTSRPEMYRDARDRLIGPHLAVLNRVLERGVAEGVIRADVDLVWVRQMLSAPVMASALTLKERIGAEQVVATVDTVLRGLAPQG